jgi:hypothetical protein
MIQVAPVFDCQGLIRMTGNLGLKRRKRRKLFIALSPDVQREEQTKMGDLANCNLELRPEQRAI